MRESHAQVVAEVPLSETFGYATDLRSMTQGQGTFTMELARYRRVPAALQEAIIAEKKDSQLVGAAREGNTLREAKRPGAVSTVRIGVKRCSRLMYDTASTRC